MDLLNALIIALMGSGAVGMGVSFLIQLGKLFLPKWFPDESADNWRLGMIVTTAVVLLVLQTTGVLVELPQIEAAFTALATLGATLMPLLILIASWIAKATYKNVLQGVKGVGISHTPKTP